MKKKEARRKLLKSIVAGSGAITVGKVLPESWSRPVVDSVMLPAHAQTSQQDEAEPDSCVGDTVTIDSNDSFNGIAIEFNGVSSPSILAVDLPAYDDPNTFILVTDSSNMSIGRGDNWSPAVATIENNIPDGIYTRTSTRLTGPSTDNTYEVTFCVSNTVVGNVSTLTVVLVSMVQI